jgi:hypothetical protein
MSPPPTIYTPQSELDGTVAGMIVTAVVAAAALALLIGLVYWANKHPGVRKPKAQQPQGAHRPVQAAAARGAVPAPDTPGSPPPRASAPSSTQAQAAEPAVSMVADEPLAR